eukprot:CAMPEP_0195089248 /NCGR_PEP_ID=MMETSP0448-20130528/28585_1 /TAXON_ID=66468 /ORGANISM="Heterocapsa triquestra, Strain CCMP 448" /LENGTH=74 /DNA_ID=CAMNT_0040122965 /DNA_START=351 /DNA_END=572 /DNA_ORIENTATION=+
MARHAGRCTSHEALSERGGHANVYDLAARIRASLRLHFKYALAPSAVTAGEAFGKGALGTRPCPSDMIMGAIRH